MTTRKSTWLQIRLTPEQKSLLRSKAEAAGEDLSAYVLQRTLGLDASEVDKHIRWMLRDPDRHFAYAEFEDLLLAMPAHRAVELAERPKDFDRLSPWQQNLVAAKIEMRSTLWGVQPPAWTLDVPSLEQPYFAAGLMNLRPYLLVKSPVPFRRRNLFVEYGIGGRLTPLSAPATPEESLVLAEAFRSSVRGTRRMRVAEGSPGWGDAEQLSTAQIRHLLEELDRELAPLGVVGELHLVGGAVMCLVYNARETTKDVDALFAPPQVIRDAVARIAEREGVSPEWMNDAVKGFLASSGQFDPYLERANLRVYVARPDYLFAMKCLAMRLDKEYRDADDIRFLARFLGVSSADSALNIVERYYPVSRVSPKIRFALEELLSESGA